MKFKIKLHRLIKHERLSIKVRFTKAERHLSTFMP
jgi:hypothetical protein